MISEFIREQKRYTRDKLKNIFACSDADIVRIIKKLKSYGVLKVVKCSDEQLNMSDLIEEEVEVIDEDNTEKKYLYVFTFVGIIIIEGRVLKCYPKYLFKTEKPTEELKQVLKVLQKYNSKEQIIKMYNDGGNVTSFNRLAVIVNLLNDYFENGIYSNTQDIIETNGMGEIHWDRTINNTYPILRNEHPYYVELQTKRRINDEEDFFQRLHECILTTCSNELKDADLLELLDIEAVELTEEKLSDFAEDDYILYRLEKEMNVQFNTRKQLVLKTIEALILNKGTVDDNNSFSIYGTNSFNLVWEKVCADVFDDQLHTVIENLNIGYVAIPPNATYTAKDELLSVVGKPKWQGYLEDGSVFEKEADKTLIPDLISVYRNEGKCDFIIFDAKYYTLQLERQVPLQGHPGIGDVTKQYLYQLAYRDFVNANNFSKVRNCFLMPTEEEGKDGVIKKGAVKLDMLDALGLEQIQVRQLSARRMYAYYLSRQKLDIGLLEL